MEKELPLVKVLFFNLKESSCREYLRYVLETKEFKSYMNRVAGYTSMAMTDYYTRAAIPEMVVAIKTAAEAANKLFE